MEPSAKKLCLEQKSVFQNHGQVPFGGPDECRALKSGMLSPEQKEGIAQGQLLAMTVEWFNEEEEEHAKDKKKTCFSVEDQHFPVLWAKGDLSNWDCEWMQSVVKRFGHIPIRGRCCPAAARRSDLYDTHFKNKEFHRAMVQNGVLSNSAACLMVMRLVKDPPNKDLVQLRCLGHPETFIEFETQ